jgi:hypothetical protein
LYFYCGFKITCLNSAKGFHLSASLKPPIFRSAYNFSVHQYNF